MSRAPTQRHLQPLSSLDISTSRTQSHALVSCLGPKHIITMTACIRTCPVTNRGLSDPSFCPTSSSPCTTTSRPATKNRMTAEDSRRLRRLILKVGSSCRATPYSSHCACTRRGLDRQHHSTLCTSPAWVQTRGRTWIVTTSTLPTVITT